MSKTKDVLGWRRENDPEAFPTGRNYLLCIAIDKYRDKRFPELNNCVRDARALVSVLIERYQFSENEVITLYDEKATSEGIYEAFMELVEGLEANDNLVIYYSGHGEFLEYLCEHKRYYCHQNISQYLSA